MYFILLGTGCKCLTKGVVDLINPISRSPEVGMIRLAGT